jgi:type I restriction enzyme S subunit
MKLTDNRKNWTRVRLDDVVVRREENDKADAQSRFDSFVKVDHMEAGSLHLKGVGSQKDEELPPTFYKIFRKGQILFPTRNPHLRRTALAHCDGICGEKTLTLEVNEKVADPRLIPFLFHSASFYDHTAGAIIGSTNPHCRWRDVANYEFLLPPKDQQAKLAELLWAADKSQEMNLKMLSRLTALKEAHRKERFGIHPGDDTIALGQVTEMTAGGTPRTTEPEYWENGDILWMSSGEVHKKRVRSTEKTITSLGFKNSSAKLIPQHSCLIALAGQGKTKGTVAINEVELTTNQSVAAIIPKRDLVDPYYLFHNLDSRYADFRHITGKGNARTGLNLSILKNFKIRFHEIEEMREIVATFDRLDTAIDSTQVLAESAKILKQTLINQIF